MIPALLPQMKSVLPGPRLAILDSQFCDLTQTARLRARDDHFVVRAHPKVHFHLDAKAEHAKDLTLHRGVDERGRNWSQDWGWLGTPGGKKSQYVRRITLQRSGESPIVIYSSLLDPLEFPATDLLTIYLTRWGIERVFQQITEVFDLRSLIGTTPQGTVFQLSFCLLLYNMIQVVRTHVAYAGRPVETLSTELLYEDVASVDIAGGGSGAARSSTVACGAGHGWADGGVGASAVAGAAGRRLDAAMEEVGQQEAPEASIQRICPRPYLRPTRHG